MSRTLTDFSQLSKGMFRKSEPVVEVKPVPKETAAGWDDALAYFGLKGRGKGEEGRGKREVWLEPANPKFPVVKLKPGQELDYFGKVTACIHRF